MIFWENRYYYDDDKQVCEWQILRHQDMYQTSHHQISLNYSNEMDKDRKILYVGFQIGHKHFKTECFCGNGERTVRGIQL